MSTARLLAHSQRMLRRYPIRAAITAFAALIGVTALTLVLSVGRIANERVVNTVHQLFGGASIGLVAGGTQFLGGLHGDSARLTVDDIDAIAREVPRIVQWDAQQSMRATVRHGDVARSARVLGQTERAREVWNRTVVRGEFFDAQAVASAARVALVGQTLAQHLFGTDDPIGSDITLDGVPFQIIGVLEPFGTDIHGMDRDNELVVPLTTLQRRVLNVDTISQAKLIVDDPAAVTPVSKDVERVLRARHGLPDGRGNDFTMLTADDIQQIAGTVQKILVLYLPLIAIACLVGAGVIAMTLMLTSISERTAEIGIRRAVGALPGHIALQIVAETATTIAIGGFLGVLVGWVIAKGAAMHMHLGDGISWSVALAGVGLSLVVGIAAGVIPARRAARLHPVDALR